MKDEKKKFCLNKLIIVCTILISQCTQTRSKDQVNLTTKIDSEIVLINIENGDRRDIGETLLTINKCNPTLIAIDAWFIGEKSPSEDSVLMNAFSQVQNDVLAYSIDSTGKLLKSNKKFSNL